MNNERNLFVISGPSGSGKNSVVAKLMQLHPGLEESVSATTRAPREGEENGVHYFFLTKEQFEEHIRKDELLEYTQYVDNYYGTLKSQVDERLERGVICILVIEVEGADNVKRQYPGCTTVFIQPPSMQELERRLFCRGTECRDRMEKRLERAREEMKKAGEYDFTLVNDDLDACVAELYDIMQKRQAGLA